MSVTKHRHSVAKYNNKKSEGRSFYKEKPAFVSLSHGDKINLELLRRKCTAMISHNFKILAPIVAKLKIPRARL